MTPFGPLSADMVEHLFGRADDLLADVGIELAGDVTALELFAGAGARIDGERVRFPPGLAGDLIRRSAPARFRQCARNPARSVMFGDRQPVFAPASGPPFVHATDTGGRRYATLADFRGAARMVQASDALAHGGGGYCEPVDGDAATRHLDMLHAVLTLTDKPFIGVTRSPEQVADSLDMGRIACGDDVFAREACVLNLFNVESPLVLTGPVARGIRMTAAAGQAALISSYSMMGMTSPVTPADALALMLAEVQAAAALTQIVRPGAPVLCGIYAVPFSMTAMRPVFGAVESLLVMAAGAQLVHALGVPFRADGAVTSAKILDAQAGRDSAFGLGMAHMTGSDFVLHAAGWMEAGLALSFDKLAFDVGVIGQQQQAADTDATVDPATTPCRSPGAAPTADELLAAWQRPAIDDHLERALETFVDERRRRYRREGGPG